MINVFQEGELGRKRKKIKSRIKRMGKAVANFGLILCFEDIEQRNKKSHK